MNKYIYIAITVSFMVGIATEAFYAPTKMFDVPPTRLCGLGFPQKVMFPAPERFKISDFEPALVITDSDLYEKAGYEIWIELIATKNLIDCSNVFPDEKEQ